MTHAAQARLRLTLLNITTFWSLCSSSRQRAPWVTAEKIATAYHGDWLNETGLPKVGIDQATRCGRELSSKQRARKIARPPRVAIKARRRRYDSLTSFLPCRTNQRTCHKGFHFFNQQLEINPVVALPFETLLLETRQPPHRGGRLRKSKITRYRV
jgi:hypothetical protein